ncbi:MAG: hypothetical protein Q8N48_15560, partial [Thiobacillus sp.]|nr:hypothetical protein [Thiobacillus sp.]
LLTLWALRQAMCQAHQPHSHHPIPDRVSLTICPAMHQKFVGRLQVFAGAVKAPARFGVGAFLHFNGHQAKAMGIDQQVDPAPLLLR